MKRILHLAWHKLQAFFTSYREQSSKKNTYSLLTTDSFFIGREQEINELEQLYYSAKQGKGRVAVVTGQRGVGKTRAIHEFLRQKLMAGENFLLARGSYNPKLARQVAFFPMMQALKDLLASRHLFPLITQKISATPLARNLLFSGLHKKPQTDPSLEDLSLIQKEEIHYHLQEAFLEVSQDNFLVLFFDNLQWYDNASLVNLSLLCRKASRYPLLILLAYNEQQVHIPPALEKVLQSDHCEHFPLNRFSSDLCFSYLEQLFWRNSFPRAFFTRFYQVTQGSPIFCSELAQFMIEEKIVMYQRGKWHSHKDLANLSLPSSLELVAAKRVRKFMKCKEKESKKFLQKASIQGQIFSLSLIPFAKKEKKFSHKTDSLLLPSSPLSSHLPSSNWQSFARSLYSEIIYWQLPQEERLEKEKRFIELLEKKYYPYLGPVAAQLAFYLTRTSSYFKASQYHLLAAFHEMQKYAFQEAILHCRIGLHLLSKICFSRPKGFHLQADLYLLWGICLFHAQQPRAGRDKLEKALEIIRKKGQTRRLARIFFWLAKVEFVLQSSPKPVFYLEKALEQQKISRKLKVHIQLELAKKFLESNSWRKAEKLLLTAKNQTSSPLHQIIVGEYSAEVKKKIGKWPQAHEIYRNLIVKCREENRTYLELNYLQKRAELYFDQGKWQNALTLFHEALELGKKLEAISQQQEIERGITRIYIKQGKKNEALAMLHGLCARLSENSPLSQRGRVWFLQGEFKQSFCCFHEALQRYNQALVCYEKDGNSKAQAECQLKSCELYLQVGMLSQLRNKLQFLSQQQSSEHLPLDKTALEYLQGALALAENRVTSAQEIFSKALRTYESKLDQCGRLRCLADLANVELRRGNYQQAGEIFAKISKIQEKLGGEVMAITNYLTWAKSLLAQGQTDRSQAMQQQAYEIAHKNRDIRQQIYVLRDLAFTWVARKKEGQAEKLLQQALALSHKIQDECLVTQVQEELGRVYRYQKKFSQSKEFLKKALTLQRQRGYDSELTSTFHQLGRLYQVQQKWEKAKFYFSKARKWEKRYHRLQAIKTLNHMGEILLAQGQILPAMESFAKGASLAEKAQEIKGQAYTYMGIGRAYTLLNRIDKALENFEKSLQLWQHISHRELAAKVHFILAKLYQKDAQIENARSCLEAAYRYYRNVNHLIAEKIGMQLQEIEEVE